MKQRIVSAPPGLVAEARTKPTEVIDEFYITIKPLSRPLRTFTYLCIRMYQAAIHRIKDETDRCHCEKHEFRVRFPLFAKGVPIV